MSLDLFRILTKGLVETLAKGQKSNKKSKSEQKFKFLQPPYWIFILTSSLFLHTNFFLDFFVANHVMTSFALCEAKARLRILLD